MASTTGDCSWEQTYTGSCSVGSERRVNEVELVVRDLFTTPSVRVRDVRAVLVFSIEIDDGVEYEKYYLHVVVRGLPWGGRNEDALDASSVLHPRTFSDFFVSAYGAPLRSAYLRLHSFYHKPIEGTGVFVVLFTRDKDGTVSRQVVQSGGHVPGFRQAEYLCQGSMPLSLVGSSSMPLLSHSETSPSVSGLGMSARLNDSWNRKRGWRSSDDEEQRRSVWRGPRRRGTFSDYLDRYRYDEDDL